jgi:hypothetical protein
LKKIAILGSAESREQAPFSDESWEIWDLAWQAKDEVRTTRAFEVHDWQNVLHNPTPFYADWLKTQTAVPVYCVHDIKEHVKAYKPLPLDKIRELMGRDYFTSSFSYIIAAAILEEPAEIGVWGIHLHTNEEYEHQRPCAEYLLGIARGKGIKVTVAEGSALLKANFAYGRSAMAKAAGIDEDVLTERVNAHTNELNHALQRCNTVGGLRQEAEFFIRDMEDLKPQTVEEVLELARKRVAIYMKDHMSSIEQVNMLKGKKAEAELLLSYAQHFNRGGAIPRVNAKAA